MERPTADEMVLMSIEIAMGRRMEESSVSMLKRSYRDAWRAIEKEVQRAERDGLTIEFPD